MGIKVPSIIYQVRINELMSNTCIIYQSRDIDVFPLSISRDPIVDDTKPQGTIKTLDHDPRANESKLMGIYQLEVWH